MSSKNSEYNADSIQVVQNTEHVRLRPNMYIADTKSAGLHQLIKEIVDNSIDEHLAGFCSEISITLRTDNQSITVEDNGRGIPTDIHPKTGISTLATVFLMTGAGGKFNSDAYSTSAGLHGVGVTVVNALSEQLNVWSLRKGSTHGLEFSKGACSNTTPSVKPYNGPKKSGTIVRFVPDFSIFKNVKFDPEKIRSFVRNISYLNSALTLKFIVKNDTETVSEEIFHESGGLKAFVEHSLADDKTTPFHDLIYFKNDSLEVCCAWTDAKNESWHSYANSSNTPEGGTHVTAVKRLITNTISSKATKAIETDDLRAGFFAAIHVKVKQPQFKSQTKDKLLNKEVESEVYDALKEQFQLFVASNPKVVENIIQRAVRLKTARDKFEAEKDSAKNVVIVKRDSRGLMPDKLVEAPDCAPEDRELYICEGNSAGGAAKQARNTKTQEVLSLKGKIPNAIIKSKAFILENEELSNIITCVGAGINEKCQPSKARVGKVLLLMDADPDGKHITALMLAFFNKFMPEFVDAGMLYYVASPLFRGKWKDKNYFGNSIDDIMKQVPNGAKPHITRLKGHGECRTDEIKEYAMDPKTRSVIQVTRDSSTDSLISDFLGSDSSSRKILLGLEA